MSVPPQLYRDAEFSSSSEGLLATKKTTSLRSYSSCTISMPPTVCEGKSREAKNEHMSCAIIGFSDGLTVPFALTAGLSAIGSSRLVIAGGLAELFAGAISMGLGAWLAAVTDEKHYEIEEQKGYRNVREKPELLLEDVYDVFADYGCGREAVAPIVDQLRSNEDMLIKFLLNFQHQISKPNKYTAVVAAWVMATSYFLGGLIPMIPYFICDEITRALFASIGITVIILILFGYVKAVAIGTNQRAAVMSALQTLVVGLLAAGASYGIVRGVNNRLVGSLNE